MSYSSAEAGSGESFGVLKLLQGGLVWYGVASIALGVFDYATDVLHMADSGEWDRRAPLLDELIFGGNPPPDPEDDHGFRELLDRIVRYGGVTAGALCAALGVAPSAISRWRSGKNLPHKYARNTIIDTAIKLMKFED